ncbi:MAG: phosphoribosyltransferase family protein [Candidatus Woesearchaeota archaeon]
MVFENRTQAGHLLANLLFEYQNRDNVIVLGIPRGGVVVAKEIARVLSLPLNIYISRKVALPNDPELGIGAISELNTTFISEQLISYMHCSKEEIKKIIEREKKELKRRILLYRKNNKLRLLKNKTIILVDDGLAMGFTAYVAILSLKKRSASQIIFACPVAAHDNFEKLKKETGIRGVTLHEYFESSSIGSFYKDFHQVSDDEVVNMLKNKNKI